MADDLYVDALFLTGENSVGGGTGLVVGLLSINAVSTIALGQPQ